MRAAGWQASASCAITARQMHPCCRLMAPCTSGTAPSCRASCALPPAWCLCWVFVQHSVLSLPPSAAHVLAGSAAKRRGAAACGADAQLAGQVQAEVVIDVPGAAAAIEAAAMESAFEQTDALYYLRAAQLDSSAAACAADADAMRMVPAQQRWAGKACSWATVTLLFRQDSARQTAEAPRVCRACLGHRTG